MTAMHPEADATIRRLLGATGRGSGQSGIVADFLLAWWNPDGWRKHVEQP